MSSKKIYHQHTRFLNNSKLNLSPRLFIHSLWPRSYSWKDPQCTFKVQQCMEYSASTQQMQLPTATPTILRSRPSCTLLLVNPSPQRWAARISLLSISTSTSSPCSHCSHIQTNALPGPNLSYQHQHRPGFGAKRCGDMYWSGGRGHGEPHFPSPCPALFGVLSNMEAGPLPNLV